MSKCRANECKYPHSHVTKAHRCGKCGDFGHGLMECGNEAKIAALTRTSLRDRLPERFHCDLSDCACRWSHTSEAHHCKKCGGRAHCMTNCPRGQKRRRGGSQSSDNPRARPRSIFSRWAMDGDAIRDEQPEPSEKKRPSEKLYNVKCPVCRKVNKTKKIKKVFVDSKCVACMENNAQVLMEKCAHVCLCTECFTKMNEVSDNEVSDDDEEKEDFVMPVAAGPAPDNPEDYITDDNLEEKANSVMGDEPGMIYVVIPGEMGSIFYFRRNSRRSPIEKLHMAQDDWGQYNDGYSLEHHNFTNGYREVH